MNDRALFEIYTEPIDQETAKFLTEVTMNDRLTPQKHQPERVHRPKGHWRDRIKIPESVLEAAVGLPTPDLSIPFYHRERFQKIVGLTGAVGGAVLSFVPGAQTLGEILGGLGLGAWSTAEEFHRIKRKTATGDRSWWTIFLEIVRKLLEAFRKSK